MYLSAIGFGAGLFIPLLSYDIVEPRLLFSGGLLSTVFLVSLLHNALTQVLYYMYTLPHLFLPHICYYPLLMESMVLRVVG